MKQLDVLIKSVETRKPISFEYKKPGESTDKRIGNVHAIYTLTNDLGEEITEMHIYQTDGGFDNSLEKLSARFRAINIQEEFLCAYLRDSGFMRRRLNQRIVQALGRCNRSPDDFSVYVLADRRFASHFGRESNRVGLSNNMIAEIDLAEDMAELKLSDLRLKVSSFRNSIIYSI